MRAPSVADPDHGRENEPVEGNQSQRLENGPGEAESGSHETGGQIPMHEFPQQMEISQPGEPRADGVI